MPDRDYLPGVPRHWRSAARHWTAGGGEADVVAMARTALARSLRDLRAELGESDTDPARLCERLIWSSLLAPTRARRLRRVPADSLDADEVRLMKALAPDVAHFAGQLARGARPRVRSQPRQPLHAILATPVEIRLP
jgi:hypothetical protein